MYGNMPMEKRNNSQITVTMAHEYAFAASEKFSDIRLPPDVQMKRFNAVLNSELTPIQREVVVAVMSGQRIKDIAADRAVSPSSICRTARRGFARLRRFLRY